METDATSRGAARRFDLLYCPDCRLLGETTTGTCARCPPRPTPFAAGLCPRCRGPLSSEAVGGTHAARCRACRGRFFERGTVAVVLDLRLRPRGERATVLSVQERLAQHGPAPEPQVGHPPCPRCEHPTVRHVLGRRSGVTVEACAEHGLWFDPGMFERFAAYVEAGGLDLLPADLERERSEEQARRRFEEIDKKIRTTWDDGGAMV